MQTAYLSEFKGGSTVLVTKMNQSNLKFGGNIWINERGAYLYECFCGYKFVTSGAYEIHVQLAHQSEFMPQSPIEQRNVVQHFGHHGPAEQRQRGENSHGGRKIHKPRYEPKNGDHNRYRPFNNNGNGNRVIPQQKLICTKCDRRYDNLELLRSHVQKHHQFPCNLCPVDTEKTFDTEKGLWSHQRNRHATKFPYRCNVCPRAFPHDNALIEHTQRIHARGNNVKCDFCPKILMSKFEKNEHIKKMHSDRRYHCRLCDVYSTTNEINLRRHTKEKHPGQMQPRSNGA